MRRGVRTGSPRAGGLAHLRVARCSFSRLKNAHHPLLTPFQGAFAGPIPLTGTVSFAWCAVTFCLVPEVETYNPASDEEVQPVEVEAEGEDSADKADDPPSPPREKVRKADDATAPSSPGAVEVQVTTSLVKSSAQKVVTAKKEWIAAVARLKAASYGFDAKVEYTEKQWKRKLTDAKARNLEKKLDLATAALQAAKCREAEARAALLEARMGVLCYQIALRDAKLRSLGRRLRRRRIFGMFRWGKVY